MLPVASKKTVPLHAISEYRRRLAFVHMMMVGCRDTNCMYPKRWGPDSFFTCSAYISWCSFIKRPLKCATFWIVSTKGCPWRFRSEDIFSKTLWLPIPSLLPEAYTFSGTVNSNRWCTLLGSEPSFYFLSFCFFYTSAMVDGTLVSQLPREGYFHHVTILVQNFNQRRNWTSQKSTCHSSVKECSVLFPGIHFFHVVLIATKHNRDYPLRRIVRGHYPGRLVMPFSLISLQLATTSLCLHLKGDAMLFAVDQPGNPLTGMVYLNAHWGVIFRLLSMVKKEKLYSEIFSF